MSEFHSLLPSNASKYEKALEQVVRSDMCSPIRSLWNAVTCPESLMYVLAITTDVDEWDDKWPRDAKSQTLLDAYQVHSKKGTPESIRRVLRNACYENIEIAAGLTIKQHDGSRTYNGHFFYNWDQAWAMYRIYLEKAITNQQAKQVRRILEDTAPLHCELLGFHFTEALFLHDAEIKYDGQYNYGVA